MQTAILFFDIDGTILTEDGTRRIPDSTRYAIAEARKRGCLTFINTGRVYLNVEPMIRELGFDGYVCGCGTYIRYQESELLHHRIPQALCRETAQVARDSRIAALYEAADMNSFDRSVQGNAKLEELLAYFSEDGRRVADVSDADFHFDKFTGWFPLEQDMSRFRAFLQGRYDYIDRGTDGAYGMCEIVPQGFSKGTGIQFLLDYFQLPHACSYAFGDSTNDLSMLQYAAHSVAMGGSPEQVRQAVEYVTTGIEEDGLCRAMEHYGLL